MHAILCLELSQVVRGQVTRDIDIAVFYHEALRAGLGHMADEYTIQARLLPA